LAVAPPTAAPQPDAADDVGALQPGVWSLAAGRAYPSSPAATAVCRQPPEV